MSARDARPGYAIVAETDGTGLRVLTVSLGDTGDAEDRDRLLTQGIVDVVAELVDATAGPHQAPVAVDLRVEDGRSGLPALEAFIQAVRGLVQSYVLEEQRRIGPVNVVVSHQAQVRDREATWRYLGGQTGSFSRGATYDLREAAS